MIKKIISDKISKGEKQWCVLIDPDKIVFEEISELISLTNKSSCDFILVGGSLINHHVPMMNILNGGSHAGNNLQEMIKTLETDNPNTTF